jgi:hypothetical protein
MKSTLPSTEEISLNQSLNSKQLQKLDPILEDEYSIINKTIEGIKSLKLQLESVNVI